MGEIISRLLLRSALTRALRIERSADHDERLREGWREQLVRRLQRPSVLRIAEAQRGAAQNRFPVLHRVG